MKLSELLAELKETETYKNFKKENPRAFFCSAMLIFGDSDKIDLNFFLPHKNKISSFAMPFASLVNHPDEIKNQNEIKNLNFKVDIPDLRKLVEDKLNKKPSRLIAVLHDRIWRITCLNGLEINRLNIDAYSGEIEQKGKESLTDMVRIKKRASGQ